MDDVVGVENGSTPYVVRYRDWDGECAGTPHVVRYRDWMENGGTPYVVRYRD